LTGVHFPDKIAAAFSTQNHVDQGRVQVITPPPLRVVTDTSILYLLGRSLWGILIEITIANSEGEAQITQHSRKILRTRNSETRLIPEVPETTLWNDNQGSAPRITTREMEDALISIHNSMGYIVLSERRLPGQWEEVDHEGAN
jgi:hypothetical protein